MYSNLANVAISRKNFATALELQRRVLALTVARRGGDRPEVAVAYLRLGQMQASAGDRTAAHASVVRALEIGEVALPADHPDLAMMLRTLGNLEITAGKIAAARPHFVRSVELTRRKLGPEHIDTIESVSGLGWVNLLLGRSEALDELEQAVRAADEAQLTAHKRYPLFVHRVAEALRRRGRHAAAIENAERARASTHDLGLLAAIDTTLVQALHSSGASAATVIPVLERTIDEIRRADVDDPKSDAKRAVDLLRMACQRADDQCNNLGSVTQDGLGGVTKDVAAARSLYDKACTAGNARSCMNLGRLFEGGLGGPKDVEKAHALRIRARDGGEKSACEQPTR